MSQSFKTHVKKGANHVDKVTRFEDDSQLEAFESLSLLLNCIIHNIHIHPHFETLFCRCNTLFGDIPTASQSTACQFH